MTGSDTVAIVADDLIWASRLMEAVRRAGARAVRLSSESEISAAIEAALATQPPDAQGRIAGAIIDLFGHRYDGVRAVQRVAGAGLPVIAVAQHDDLETRKQALAAGARRVFSYQKFFTDGPTLVTGWLTADGGDR